MPQDTPREKHTYFMVTDYAARHEKKKKKKRLGMKAVRRKRRRTRRMRMSNEENGRVEYEE